ncbi:MAG: DUF5063 domain-containing protein [Frankiales bacterium]|nr:DUF5063 domain-containing protein [Frankiales bacterium]
MTDERTPSTGTDVERGEGAPADLADIAADMAHASARFVSSVEAVAAAADPDAAISILLLELSALLAAGAPLGALADVTPRDEYEPDAGAEPSLDRVRDALRDMLGPADEYAEVFDPFSGPEVVTARLSDDLADVTADLLHGLAHHAAGRTLEALWWWQFSYLNNWGQAASAAVRAIQSLMAHVRLEVPIDVEAADPV